MWIVRSVILEMREDWTGDCRIWPHFLPVGESSSWGAKKPKRATKSQGPGEKRKRKKKKKNGDKEGNRMRSWKDRVEKQHMSDLF